MDKKLNKLDHSKATRRFYEEIRSKNTQTEQWTNSKWEGKTVNHTERMLRQLEKLLRKSIQSI